MKHEFLVLYDYGQGGVWALVQARSRREIEQRFPELEVVEEPPEWMTEEHLARLKKKMSFDIDEPSDFLSRLASNSPPRGAAAG